MGEKDVSFFFLFSYPLIVCHVEEAVLFIGLAHYMKQLGLGRLLDLLTDVILSYPILIYRMRIHITTKAKEPSLLQMRSLVTFNHMHILRKQIKNHLRCCLFFKDVPLLFCFEKQSC